MARNKIADEVEALLVSPPPRKRSMFPSPRELATEYLSHEGFVKIGEGVTKKPREAFEIYGTPNGSYSIRLADSLKEIGTAYLAEKWSDAGIH